MARVIMHGDHVIVQVITEDLGPVVATILFSTKNPFYTTVLAPE